MALSECKRAANNRYIATHYQRLPISYPKEFCAEIRAAAEASGESLAGYIKRAILAQMERDKEQSDEEDNRTAQEA